MSRRTTDYRGFSAPSNVPFELSSSPPNEETSLVIDVRDQPLYGSSNRTKFGNFGSDNSLSSRVPSSRHSSFKKLNNQSNEDLLTPKEPNYTYNSPLKKFGLSRSLSAKAALHAATAGLGGHLGIVERAAKREAALARARDEQLQAKPGASGAPTSVWPISFARVYENILTTPRLSPLPTHYLDEEIEAFLKDFGAVLLQCGLPAHAVIFYVQMAAKRFEYVVRVEVLTSVLFYQFGDDMTCHMIPIISPNFSLSKMVDVTAIAEDFLSGHLDPQATLERMDHMTRLDDHFNSWAVVAWQGILAGVLAPLFGGGVPEMVVSPVVGLIIGFLSRGLSNKHVARSIDIIAGFLSSILAVLCDRYVYPVNGPCVMLCGILWFLPGFRLTLAMTDVAAGHTITGSAKLMSSFVTALNLGFGLIGGMKMNDYYLQTPMKGIGPFIPLWGVPVCVFLSGVPIAALLDAKPSHLPQLLVGMMVAYYACSLTANSLGVAFGAWLGAFLVGLLSSIYSWITRYPALELSLFSIIMLVPGSVGVRGVLSATHDLSASLSLISDMIAVALTLVAGIFTANLVLPPLRVL